MLHVHHHVVLLDAHRHRFGYEVPFEHLAALGDLHRIAARADRVRVGNRMTCADVEFPAVPGAPQDLTPAGVDVIAGLPRLDQAGDEAAAQAAALMRATVEQAEIFAVEVEDSDGTAAHRDALARARWDLADRGHDVTAHSGSPGDAGQWKWYTAMALSRRIIRSSWSDSL